MCNLRYVLLLCNACSLRYVLLLCKATKTWIWDAKNVEQINIARKTHSLPGVVVQLHVLLSVLVWFQIPHPFVQRRFSTNMAHIDHFTCAIIPGPPLSTCKIIIIYTTHGIHSAGSINEPNWVVLV